MKNRLTDPAYVNNQHMEVVKAFRLLSKRHTKESSPPRFDIQVAIIYKDLRLNACGFNTFAIMWEADFKNLYTRHF